MTESRITYFLPDSARFQKWYHKKARFDEQAWGDWGSVVDGFYVRFDGWYFEPLRHLPPHSSYLEMCCLCAIIDAFTHYSKDKDWPGQSSYIGFLRELDPIFKTKLVPATQLSRLRGKKWEQGQLKDYAEVFYAGVRCSIHHHGDLAPYVGMTGLGGLIAKELANAGLSQCGKFSYSLVLFDPGALRDRLGTWFRKYCDDLKADPFSHRSKLFKRKMKTDFGVTLI